MESDEICDDTFDPGETVKAVRDYLDRTEAFLTNDGDMLPNAGLLCRLHVPRSGILTADAGQDLIGPFIAVTIKDRERTPRLFDAWYFAAIRLMELSGGPFRLHSNRSHGDPARHDYVVFSAPAKANGMVRMLRVIADAAAGTKVAQLPASHYDYRRIVLDRLAWVKGSEPVKGRFDAINLARDLFARNAPSLFVLTLDEYKALLSRAFELADRMHRKLHREIGRAAE